MSNPLPFPLQRNPVNNEIVLPLRKHKNIVLTPTRQEDSAPLVEYFNDVRVYHWLASPPRPFLKGKLPKHAEELLGNLKALFDVALSQLEEVELGNSPTSRLYDGAPVGCIRELQEDGSDLLIGIIKIRRDNFGEHLHTDSTNWENKIKNEMENTKLERATDQDTKGSLAPSHHNKGIMTDAVDTLLQDWAVPHMAVRRVIVGAFSENIASIKMFEKNGFRRTRFIESYREVRGEMRNLQLLEREYDIEES
ncbi:hypothetical protein JR316_0000450 [Psilocybe cubensis]|uniref:N-acetyltransferase domain-containing protein n=2 Tax=Psilocybe cubensis TaxID=181762 RepID=A0A8H7Y9I4_PSICU|nr:hypothetical protein JR316_0000450 [Psilocybe cubensis]KAH9486386.1 hypothetical protein JR316_0000450 [Psilocybe cubensis]